MSLTTDRGDWSATTGVMGMTGQGSDDATVADEGAACGVLEGEPLGAGLGAPDPGWPEHDERPTGGAAWA